MSDGVPPHSRIEKILLGIGPFVVLGVVLAFLVVTSPFGDIDGLSDASTPEMLWMLTIVGTIAGVIPVLIGMLWYPFLRTLRKQWIYAVLALSAGVLTFAAGEMVGGILSNAGSAPTRSAVLAVGGAVGAFVVLLGISRWRYSKIEAGSAERSIQVAYLIAIGLGLHSIGEGMAIGTAFVQDEPRLMMLLVIAFLLDNVTEGPTIVAAVASDLSRPPLYHFAVMGIIAGGPVVVGGWIGSLADSPMLAVLFFAIGLGAILQVIYEIVKFIGFSAGGSLWTAFTRLNGITFVAGFLLMVFIDEILIDMFLF